jgi:hypothetical protein
MNMPRVLYKLVSERAGIYCVPVIFKIKFIALVLKNSAGPSHHLGVRFEERAGALH